MFLFLPGLPGPPLLPAAGTHSRARWTCDTPARLAQAPSAARPARRCQRLPVCPEPWPGATGRSPCLCQLELLVCSERQNYSPAERQRPTPWDSPGRRRSVLAPSLRRGFPERPLGTRLPSAGTSPAWLHPREERPLRPPRMGAPCGRVSAPGGAGFSHPPLGVGEGDAHMRLLGGILRPSRNQVTCGRGKLEMRGARMTAASPWETLWCFSPSSKLPMSVGGKSACRGQRPEVSNPDCPAPGWGAVAGTASRLDHLSWPHHPLPHDGAVLWGFVSVHICPRTSGFIQQPQDVSHCFKTVYNGKKKKPS